MKSFARKLCCSLFCCLAFFGTVTAQNTSPLTISSLVEQITLGIDPDENMVTPPSLDDPQHNIPSIPEDILDNVEAYLTNSGGLGEITESNYHHYLNAAKWWDLNQPCPLGQGNDLSGRGLDPSHPNFEKTPPLREGSPNASPRREDQSDAFVISTFPIRLACFLNSDGQLKSLEAFSYRLNPAFFSDYDQSGNRITNKKYELYHAGQYELVFVPEWVRIQKTIIVDVMKTVQSFSEQMGSDRPSFILFTGSYGTGKSYQIKHHPWVNQIEYNPNALFNGIMSTDSIKRIYQALVEGSTNGQVHHEGVAVRVEIMTFLLKNLPNISLIQEQCLSTTASINNLLQLATENDAKVKLVDVDTYLETSCLRILTRDPSKGDPVPGFRSIVEQQKSIREVRAHLLKKVQEMQNVEAYELIFSDENGTYLVAEKKNEAFQILPGMEEMYHRSLTPAESSIVEFLSTRIITSEDCDIYGERLRPFVGITIEEALTELSKQ